MRTDKPEAELYLYRGEEKIAELKWEAHRKLAETLHLKIDEIMISKGLTLREIERVCVYQGPGSFTGLRIGITVANTLAYSLNIPIVGAEGDAWLEECPNKENHNADPVSPIYGSDANITKPKK